MFLRDFHGLKLAQAYTHTNTLTYITTLPDPRDGPQEAILARENSILSIIEAVHQW